MNTPKQPQVGDLVLFKSNPDDSIAKSNNNDNPIPAIITRVWGPVCVNIKIIPDHGPMQDRGSVVHNSQNPAGYHWFYNDERDAVSPELNIELMRQSAYTMSGYNPETFEADTKEINEFFDKLKAKTQIKTVKL